MLEHLLLQLAGRGSRARPPSPASAACPGTWPRRTWPSSARTRRWCRRRRWPGGTAGTRRCRASGSSPPGTQAIRAGFSTALVSWYRNDLLAEPPPLAMNRNLYSVARPVGVQLDLRGQVAAGVLLLPHGQRRELGVPQVQLGVGVVDAAGDVLLVPRRR